MNQHAQPSRPHFPRKRFGQHFLVDAHYIRRIVDAIDPQPDDRIVEIGPGLGALTAPLLARVKRLHAIELDRDVVARLRDEYPAERLVLFEGDALQFDFAAIGADLRVVGNLPYNISSPLLFHLAEFSANIRDMTFMLQREVVNRMVAIPGTGDYGRLSVMLQYRFAMSRLFTVPPGAFRPPPKVESAIVRMTPLPADATCPRDPRRFAQIVSAAFSQRRKTLRNSLDSYLGPADFERLGIDPRLRAENLSVADFVRIADHAA